MNFIDATVCKKGNKIALKVGDYELELPEAKGKILASSGYIGKTVSMVVTSPIVRMYFKKLTEDYFKDLTVVSYNEVESDVELQSVGMVTI